MILNDIRFGVSVRLGPVKATVELRVLLERWSIVFRVFTSTATTGALGRWLVTLVAVVRSLSILVWSRGTIVSPGRLVLVRRTVITWSISLVCGGAPRKLRSEYIIVVLVARVLLTSVGSLVFVAKNLTLTRLV